MVDREELKMRIALYQLVLVVVSVATAQAAETRIHCDGQEENLATYLQIHDVLFMQRDTSRVEEFYADEVISHNQDGGGAGAQVVRPDDLKAFWESSKKNDPSRVLEDDLILCVDDFVVVRTTLTGINEGPVLGQPATGKSYSNTAMDIYRFENGKVVERWGNADLIHRYRQLGFRMQKMPDED